MLQWIISSCVLIAAVLLLRFVLKGRISLRLQYALWGLVLVRLLLPVSIGSSSISVSNLAPVQEYYSRPLETVDMQLPDAEYDFSMENTTGEQIQQSESVNHIPEVLPTTQIQPQDPVTDLPEAEPVRGISLSTGQILGFIWLGGAFAVGVWFFTVNLRMRRRLRATREPVEAENCSLPVYVTEAVDTPCLFGLFRPVIYLTPESMEDAHTQHYALIHEQVHRRHGDHLWAILRCLCQIGRAHV